MGSLRVRHLFEIQIFCNILNFFTATFDHFNVSLLNKKVSFKNNIKINLSDPKLIKPNYRVLEQWHNSLKKAGWDIQYTKCTITLDTIFVYVWTARTGLWDIIGRKWGFADIGIMPSHLLMLPALFRLQTQPWIQFKDICPKCLSCTYPVFPPTAGEIPSDTPTEAFPNLKQHPKQLSSASQTTMRQEMRLQLLYLTLDHKTSHK